jgi:hypothetical protein
VNATVDRMVTKLKTLLEDRSAAANQLRGMENTLDSFDLGLRYTKLDDIAVIIYILLIGFFSFLRKFKRVLIILINETIVC